MINVPDGHSIVLKPLYASVLESAANYLRLWTIVYTIQNLVFDINTYLHDLTTIPLMQLLECPYPEVFRAVDLAWSVFSTRLSEWYYALRSVLRPSQTLGNYVLPMCPQLDRS